MGNERGFGGRVKKGGCVRKGLGKQEWGEQVWWRAVPYGCRRSGVSC